MGTYNYIESTGVIIPDTSDILAEVQAEYRGVFGDDLDVSADTPQGALIVAETSSRASVVRNNAAVANQLNPQINGGIFQDAVGMLMGLEREGRKQTVVLGAVLGGTPGTPIPAGSQAKLADNTLFRTETFVTIGLDGTAVVDFRAVDYGPIVVAAGALNRVGNTIFGWDSVTNPDAGITGRLKQGDENYRELRNKTLARQTISVPEAIISALYDPENVPGLRSLSFRENITGGTLTIDGIVLLRNSIWVCCDGGDDADIAKALLPKTVGANYNGAVTVPIVEPWSGQTYPVKFDRSAPVATKCRVTIGADSGEVADPLIAIPADVVAYAAGEVPGDRGFVTGQAISPWEIASAINYFHPKFYIKKVEVATVAGVFSTDNLPIALNQVGRITASSVTVVIA